MRIPFRWMPASIGLKGNSYKIAEAEYTYTGEELEYKLADIENVPTTDEWHRAVLALDLKYKKKSEYEYQQLVNAIDFQHDAAGHHRAILELDHKHEKISSYNYQVELVELDCDDATKAKAFLDVERQFNKISSDEYNRAKIELEYDGEELVLEKLHLDFKEGKLSEKEYTKAVATINDTAWVNGEIKLDASGKAFLEMDWNEAFIEGLRDKGYTGLNDEEIISTWWTNVNMHDIEDFAPSLETNVTPLGAGKSEIS